MLMTDEHFKWCKICDSHADLCVVEGSLRVLEIWEKEKSQWYSKGEVS